ncbi:MAG: magnesium transporter [Cyanobacteria bacterium]|nr:magnesium transporter [Cyanobacteriota bacterium]
MPEKSVKAASDLGLKVKKLLAFRNASALRRLLSRHNFADVADVFENFLEEDEVAICFPYLNIDQAAQVLTSVSEERQKICLSALSPNVSSQIVRLMAADDAVDLLQELEPAESKKILGEMPLDLETRTIHNLLMEEPDSAGGIMSTDFIQTSVDGTVGDALRLIKDADEKDFVYYCYLVNSDEKLVGVVSLKQLIIHDESELLSKIAIFDVKSLLLTYDQEFVATVFRKYYNLLAMPVIDDQEILQGIITLDDVVDVIDEETSEDFYRASGITMEEIDEKHLLTGPMIGAVKARLPWLCITLVGQFVAAAIIASYSHTVQKAVIAISFMPLLTGLSGNMGTQSESISVRGLALSLINDQTIRSLMFRELKVALTMGTFLAISFSILSFLQYHHIELTLLLYCAITINLCLAGSLGLFIPYAYRKYVKQDPAGVGGPFITTLMDMLTFSTYLYVVTQFIDKMI